MSKLLRKIHIVCLLPPGPIVLMSMLASLLHLKSCTKLRPLASVLPLRVVTAGDGRYVEVDRDTNLFWITPTLPPFGLLRPFTPFTILCFSSQPADTMSEIGRFDARVLRVPRMAVAATVSASTRSACLPPSHPKRRPLSRHMPPTLT